MPNLDFGDGLFLDSKSSEADYTSKAGTPLNIVLNLVCHIVLKKWKLKMVSRHRYSVYPFFLEVHEDSGEIQDLLWKSSINLPNKSSSRSIFLFNLECYCGCGSSIGFVYTRKISGEGRKDVKTLRLSQFLCLLNGNCFVPYYCRTN